MWTRLILAAAVAALVLPAAALAKGASQATVSGPGLKHPIAFGGGEVDGSPVMSLVEAAGFFPSVFGQSPNPMLRRRPATSLGPRYRVVYVVPGPNGRVDRLRQDLYPYAKPHPFAYTAPSQRFWGTERTRGGWYPATAELKSLLVARGLPRSRPSG